MKVVTQPSEVVLVQVSFCFVKRGGRKEMILPEVAPRRGASVDSTVVKALARAFRWKRMLDSGEFATIAELAEHERIAPTYMTRILRLTLLAPKTVEAILDGRQDAHAGLATLMEPFPMEWCQQRARSVRMA